MVVLHKATIKQLRELLDQKQISAVELTDYFLSRIEKLDGTLNSFITVCADQAREQAKAAQQLIDRGSVRAWTGIPVALKDNLCTEGVLTTCGSKMLANFTPPYDATVAKKLKGYGAVLIGKTNLDEFDLGSTTKTSYFGGTKNPLGVWSEGSAACVAAGLAPVALGSDNGGTLCQPAAFCGITGLRPTYGCVSRYGLVGSTSSMDQIGPLAKSAVDCALMMDAITDYDPNDATMSQPNCFDYSQRIGKSLSGMTVGLLTIDAQDSDPQVMQAVLSAADAYRQMGCTIKEVSLPSHKYAVAAFTILSSAEIASNLARYDGIKFGYRSKNAEDYDQLVKNTRAEGFGSEAKGRILLGNHFLSKGSYEIYYKKAMLLRQQIKQEYAALFESCDFIITPTMAYSVGNHPMKHYQTDVYSAAVSLAGLPALTTPCGYDQQGMPIGMTLVGRPFDEATILGAAAVFESGFARREVSL